VDSRDFNLKKLFKLDHLLLKKQAPKMATSWPPKNYNIVYLQGYQFFLKIAFKADPMIPG
jgi:hypothetical protein